MGNGWWDELGAPDKFKVVPDGLLELGEREKIKFLGLQLLRRVGPTDAANVSQGEPKQYRKAPRGVPGYGRTWLGLPQVLLHESVRIFVLKGHHAAPGVLDQDDFVCAQQLLRDDDAAKAVDGRTPSLSYV